MKGSEGSVPKYCWSLRSVTHRARAVAVSESRTCGGSQGAASVLPAFGIPSRLSYERCGVGVLTVAHCTSESCSF
jgi:hypothetical protein